MMRIEPTVQINGFIDIVRILLMVPIYATVSFASYLFWVCHSRI